MARDFTVRARIVAEDEASSTIGKVESRFQRFTGFLRSNTVVTFGDLANVVGRAVNFLGSFVTSAFESESAINRLATAVGDLGPATARVNEELVAQAEALQRVTRFGDEQILGAQTLLLNLGATAEQVPKATEAAVELAAAFRIDLNQAAQLVGRTLQGFADRQISRMLPALKDLGEESLKAGEGVDLILSRFEGAAAADLETFSGQIAQLGNAFDDLREKIGGSITDNEEARASLERIREIFADPQFLAAIEAVTGSLSRFVSELLDPETGLPSIPKDLQKIVDFFRGLTQIFDFGAATESVAEVNEEASGLLDTLARAPLGAFNLFGLISQAFDALGVSIPAAIGALKDWIQSVTAAGTLMRELGVSTSGTATSTSSLGTAQGEARVSGDAMNVTAQTSAQRMAALRREADAATAAVNRLRAAQAALAAAGPVSVQGASAAPRRANTVG